MDNKQGPEEAGFDKVIIVRDVAPNCTRAEIESLRTGIGQSLAGYPIETVEVLEIMEFEAWLLAMADHFYRVDGRLTVAAITDAVGSFPSCENCQDFDRPSHVFRQILNLAEIEDFKAIGTIRSIVKAFDLNVLVESRAPSIPDLHRLIDGICPK